VLLRINPGQARGALRMGGSSQFGMSPVDAERGLELAATWPEVRVRGFHGFLASGLLDADDVVGNARVLLESVAPLLPLLREPMTLLDLGGGFGIPYHAGERALDLDAVRAGLEGLVAPFVDGTGTRACFEAGRFLMGPAGVLLCRVVDVKVNGGRRFVVLDGGSNVCGLFAGRHTGRALPFQVLRSGVPVSDTAEPATICGPLCTPMDRLANTVACGADEGDLVVWHQCGAYGASAGLSDFLSFDRPYEVVIEHDRVVWQSSLVEAP
jgi:diaminopimelate decarboxylase